VAALDKDTEHFVDETRMGAAAAASGAEQRHVRRLPLIGRSR